MCYTVKMLHRFYLNKVTAAKQHELSIPAVNLCVLVMQKCRLDPLHTFLNIIFPVERPKAVFIFAFVFIPQRGATMEQTSPKAGVNQNSMRIIKKWPHPGNSLVV